MLLRLPHLLLLSLLMLHIAAVHNVPYHHKQLYAHRGMDINHKTLFTLGALAVLGGASYYLGKHEGYYKHKAPPFGYNLQGPPVGYPAVGYPTPPIAPPLVQYQPYQVPYKHVNVYKYGAVPSYANYGFYNGGSNLHNTLIGSYPPPPPKKKGFAAGIYAHPIYGYPFRRRRQATGADILSSDTTQSYLDPRTTGSFGASQAQFFDSYQLGQANLLARSSVSSSEDTEAKKVDKKSSKRIIFRDEDTDEVAVLSRKKRRTTEKGVAVATGTIKLENDPRNHFSFQNLGTRNSQEYQPLTRTGAGTRLQSHLRSLSVQSPGIDGWPSQRPDPLLAQRLNCEPQGRQFDHFSEMMLESALAEDSDGCGQSLLCVIGRTPLQNLPPKAIGLRQLLKQPSTASRQQATWRSLSEALLAGESRASTCSALFPRCTVPEEQLLGVFATL